MDRRAFLGSAAALGLSAAAPAATHAGVASELDSHELVVGAEKDIARRARVLVPRAASSGDKLPVLVLLHGLGETTSERLGMSAWPERYGLVRAYERLLRPPVTREISGTEHWSQKRLSSVNAELAANPMRGVILVCPVTPNVYRMKPTHAALDRYTGWVEAALLPAVQAQFPAAKGAQSTALDGCSLGGYIALELFLRKPALFGAVGVVQAAIGESRADDYARRLETAFAKSGPKPIHLLTSSWDPYRRAHERLARRLEEKHVPNELDVLPGGHDQIFLREIGTLTMLLWHERRFRSQAKRPGVAEGRRRFRR